MEVKGRQKKKKVGAESKSLQTTAQLDWGAPTQTWDWLLEIAATGASGRGEFKAAFAR